MGVLQVPIPTSKLYRRRPEIRRRAGLVLTLCSLIGHMRYSKVFAARLLSSLIFALGLATASGQTVSPGTSQLPVNEPLEKYDMPPAYIYRLETSPRMVSPYGGFISYQVNVDANGNNIVGDAANEPSITVDPTNPNTMVIGWRQFNSVSSNFRQGGWAIPQTAAFIGPFQVFWRTTSSAAIRSCTPTRWNVFLSQSVGDILRQYLPLNKRRPILVGTATGRKCGEEGTRSGSPIDRTNGTGHGFQYQAWSQPPLALAGCSAAPPMPELHGRLR